MKIQTINNKHYQECDVVMLPTDKADGCLLKGFKTLQYYPKEFFTQEYLKSTNRKSEHLYILSNDEIKEGDLVLNTINKQIEQVVKISDLHYIKNATTKTSTSGGSVPLINCKKIIATTDSSLISEKDKNNIKEYPESIYDIKFLSSISKSFIEHFINEYNKGNVISKVLVEVEIRMTDIIIGKTIQLIKLNQNNEISILTEQKQSYSREEVVNLIKLFADDCEHNKELTYYNDIDDNGKIWNNTELEQWINQNLK